MDCSRSLLLVLPVALCLTAHLTPTPAAIVATGDVDPDPETTPWTSTTTGYVGKTADGTLTVDSGSHLVSRYGNIGYADTATGLVTVHGTGSRWANTCLYVGQHGSATLNITTGGAVTNTYGYIGYNFGSAGLATVDGTGSRWINSRELYVGHEAGGTLSVSDSGAVSSWSGYIGYNSVSTGVVTVEGAGSTWSNSDDLYVAHRGGGTLNITSGGTVSNSDGYIGYNSGSTGVVAVEGAGSTWSNSRRLYVGSQGNGTLSITNGGTVSNADDGYIGLGLFWSTGVVTVEGAGSTWSNSSSLYVGFDGSGTLNITDDAAVTVAQTTYVAFGFSTGSVHFGNGTLTTGSLCASPTQLMGTGTINTKGLVSDVDLVLDSPASLTQTLTFNSQPDQNISLNLDMNDPRNVGPLGAGWKGNGSLTICDGVCVDSTGGYIGYHSGSTGVVTVEGTGSTWTNGGLLYIGRSGSGTLAISGGGAVTNTHGCIGDYSGSANVVTVEGTGSRWTNNGFLYVGDSGSGTLSVTDGGAVSSLCGYLGYNYSSSTGVVTVDGTGSTWNNTYALYVGHEGGGTLNITTGAAVSNGDGYIGYDPDSTGVLTVDGGASTWVNAGDVYVGNEGSGTLNIAGGGAVSSSDGYIGYDPDSRGVVTVDGGASTWVNAGDVYVGHQGGGTLNITSGGAVSYAYGYIGYNSGSTGAVTVEDAGSTWANSEDLYVGRYGSGRLKVSNGGCVDVGDDAIVGAQGALEIGLGHTQKGALGTVPDKVGVGGEPPLQVRGDMTLQEGCSLTVFVGSRLTGPGGEAIHGDLTQTIITAGGIGGVAGTFTDTPQVGNYFADPPTQGNYLGSGVWFGNNKTGEGVVYVGAPGTVTAVDVAVFQAKPGDCNGDRTVSFADFNDLANNYTGALDPGVGEKEWRQGDFSGDADVDFGDFNDLANNYTGAGVEYGPAKTGATGADCLSLGSQGRTTRPCHPSCEGASVGASLIVYLADATGADGQFHAAGDVVLSVDGGLDEPGMRLNGYEVCSASGFLVPDVSGVAHPFLGGMYAEVAPTGIVVMSSLTNPLYVSGQQDWTLGWEYDVAAKGARDLGFYYGTSEGIISGNVLYVVPEPATITLLLLGLGTVVLLRRRRRPARPTTIDGRGLPPCRVLCEHR